MAYSQSEPPQWPPRNFPNGFWAIGNSSPVKIKYDEFNIYKTFLVARDRILEDTKDEIVYGMPVEEFLDAFLPAVDVDEAVEWETKLFSKIPDPKAKRATQTKEDVMYGPLMEHVFKKVAVRHGFMVNSTGQKWDANSTPDKSWAPDFMAYLPEYLDEFAKDNRELLLFDNPNDFSRVEIPHEVKKEDFIDDEKKTLHDSNTAKDNMGQILLVLAEVANRQHRTHVFHVFITPHIVRLSRMDRAGIVISAAILASEDSSLLHKFYYRYSRASPAMRGHDPSVKWATKVQIERARPHLKPWAPKHGRERPFHVMRLPSPESPDNKIQTRAQKAKTRDVVVWAPMMELRGVTGKMTRTYVVYDLASKDGEDPLLYFVKDTWRADNDELCTEADILRELNEENIPNVPTLLPGSGDVKDDADSIQRTRTQEFAEPDNKTKFIARIHHRLLEKLVPKRLHDFKNARSLMKVIYDAMIAYEQAYDKCAILHRDISVNNILIAQTPNGDEVGILSDWDNAIYTKTVDGSKLQLWGARQVHRTASRSFISIGLMNYPDSQHNWKDDFESFYWVVLYVCLRYLPFTVAKPAMTFSTLWEEICDKDGKFNMLMGIGSTLGLEFTDNGPLTQWIRMNMQVFQQFNVHLINSRNKSLLSTLVPAPTPPFPELLSSPKELIAKMLEVITMTEGWSDAKVDKSPPEGRMKKGFKGHSGDLSSSDDYETDGELDNKSFKRRSKKQKGPEGGQRRVRMSGTTIAANTEGVKRKPKSRGVVVEGRLIQKS